MYDTTTQEIKTQHQKDIQATNKLLGIVRRDKVFTLPDTVDGDFRIEFNLERKVYFLIGIVNGQEVSNTRLLRRELQAYLIELRERRRKEQREARKGTK